MKIQNCPLCGREANISDDKRRDGVYVGCIDGWCDLTEFVKLETWNRIRIAPDDKKVRATNLYDKNLYDTDLKDWMNPQYPKPDETKPMGTHENPIM